MLASFQAPRQGVALFGYVREGSRPFGCRCKAVVAIPADVVAIPAEDAVGAGALHATFIDNFAASPYWRVWRWPS
jgi:hypothetical protein